MNDQNMDRGPLKVSRLRGLALAFTTGIYALFAAGSLIGTIWLLLKPWPTALFSLIFLALSLGSTLLTWMSVYSVTVVWPDRIERSNGLRTRAIDRSNVKGLRINKRAKRALLIPAQEGAKSVSVPLSLVADPACLPFFDGMTDLTAEEYQRNEEALENDPRLGATPEQRRFRLLWMRRIFGGLNLAGYAVGIWVLIRPEPYAAAIYTAIAAVPLAVLLKLTMGSLVSIDQKDNDPRPTVLSLYMMPSLGLALRAVLDFNIVDIWNEFMWAAVVGVGVALVVSLAERPNKKMAIQFFSYLLFSLAYAYGALAQINYLPDRSAPAVLRTQVKNLSIGRGKVTTYEVTIGKWGSEPAGREIDVASDYYQKLHTGDTVCVYVYKGYLEFRYLDLGDCPA